MSAILNYLRYKLACNDDFRNMKSKLVSEQKYDRILTCELYVMYCALTLLVVWEEIHPDSRISSPEFLMVHFWGIQANPE